MSCSIPKLITLEDYGGDVVKFIEALYAIFKEDFINKKIIFEQQPLALKRSQSTDGKHDTFWHIISSGVTENEKIPNTGRCERIRWAAYILQNCVASKCDNLKVWENQRKDKVRVCILCVECQYLIILEKRTNYILFWTAYHIEHKHSLKKLLKEHDEYIKAKATRF